MAMVEERPRAGRIEGGYDAIVIGAEPEGLVCATYLARAGLRTVLLESGDSVGGRFRGRQFGDFLFPVADHLLHHFDRQVIRDLDLYRFGLDFTNRRMRDILLVDGAPLALDPDPWRSANMITEHWPEEGARYEEFAKALGGLGGALAEAAVDDLFGAGDEDLTPRLARLEKALSADQFSLLGKLAFSSAAEIAAAWFEEPPLRAALCYDAVFGLGVAPGDIGGGLGFLRRFMGEVAGARGAVAMPAGGVPALAEALRRAAEAAKVEMRLDCPVKEIIIEWDAAAGVHLASGGQIRANAVISARGVYETLADHFGPRQLDIEMQDEISTPSPAYGLMRFNAVLDAAPQFAEDVAAYADERFLFAPSPQLMEAAFTAATAAAAPSAPVMEIVFAGQFDDSFRNGEAQAVSGLIYPVSIAAMDEAAGRGARDALTEAVISSLEAVAPNIRERIVEAELRIAEGAMGAAPKGGRSFAQAPLAAQWMRLPQISGGGGVQGFYCCGADMALGLQTACAAARLSAQHAIKHIRKRASL